MSDFRKYMKNKGKQQNGVKRGKNFAAAAALGLAAGRLAMPLRGIETTSFPPGAKFFLGPPGLWTTPVFLMLCFLNGGSRL